MSLRRTKPPPWVPDQTARPGPAHCCRVRKFAKRRISGSPRPASGRGAGGEGLSRGRSCVEICGVSSVPRPPHPQPFSVRKGGGEGCQRIRCATTLESHPDHPTICQCARQLALQRDAGGFAASIPLETKHEGSPTQGGTQLAVARFVLPWAMSFNGFAVRTWNKKCVDTNAQRESDSCEPRAGNRWHRLPACGPKNHRLEAYATLQTRQSFSAQR